MTNKADSPTAKKYGYWENSFPMDLEMVRQESSWFFWTVEIWRYREDPLRPMTYTAPDGTQYRPAPDIETDFGSIPPFLGILPSLGRERFPGPYINHDSSCQDGGLWARRVGEAEFHFVKMPRVQCDRLLRLMVLAWGGNIMAADAIFSGVRVGAVFMKHPTNGRSSKNSCRHLPINSILCKA
jgi:hypothetical protein